MYESDYETYQSGYYEEPDIDYSGDSYPYGEDGPCVDEEGNEWW
jgi:hypothetical protein